jgi:1-acyl-sn-glycerol-3-phosphate acyltransferase
MVVLLRLLRKILGWLDFVAFTGLMYVLSLLPWGGRPAAHPVARLFNAASCARSTWISGCTRKT